MSSKRLNKANKDPLLEGLGDLVTADPAEGSSMLCLPQPSETRTLRHLCLLKGFKKGKTHQQWMRVKSAITYKN